MVLKNGKETWLLVHIEVQGYNEKEFAKRMYSYNYRIFDRYEKDVVSVAILTDSSKDYRPDTFERNYWDFKLLFKFPIIKIIDYKDKEEKLQKDKNPFSIVVLTHLKEQETKDNIDQRKFWKFTLIKSLYERGYKKEDVLSLYKFIDWVVRLPKEAEEKLLYDISRLEEVKKMPYITNAERIGMEKGLKKGIKKV